MLYALEQGRTERDILEQSRLSGRPVPDAIVKAPELWLGLEMFLDAFFVLTSSRSAGFGEGPIPWTAVNAWCAANGISGEQAEDVHYHVGKLDAVYLTYRSKKVDKGNGPTPIRTENEGKRRSR